jgi:hypothetical protein
MVGVTDADAPERTLDITHVLAVEHRGAPCRARRGAASRRFRVGGVVWS